MNKKRIILLIGIVIVVIVLIYFVFFYKNSCKDASCFSAAQKKCSKVSYLNDGEDATWLYKIKGKKKDNCIVEVKLLQAKKGSAELEKLSGLEMICSLPLGYVGEPQKDLSFCHGLLKEELQELLIQKMHSYILTNLGKIDDALKSVL